MTTPPGRRWHRPAVVAALSLVLFGLPLAFDIPLLDPDEGLHASIAREMVERDEWVTPTFLGEPFLDKPILFFWAQALSLRVFGFSEQAVRLPGLLFGWLGAFTTALVAARLLGTRGGVLAGMSYATLFFPLALAQAAVHDIALVPFVNLAVLALLPLVRGADWPRALRAAALAGAWLGLSLLTKGLAGIVFASIAVVPLLLLRQGVRPSLVAGALLTIAVTAVVAAPWYLAMEAAHPGYLRYYFLERHVGGYAGGTERHGGAVWWYYIPLVLGGGLPWIAFVPAAFQVGVRRSVLIPSAATVILLATAWLAGGLLFVSLGSAKLSTYLLPVFPAVALFAAVAWLPCIEAHPPARPFARWVGIGTTTASLASAAVIAGAATLAVGRDGVILDGWRWTLLGAVIATWILPVAAWRAGRRRASFAALAVCTAAVLLAGLGGVMPVVASRFSDRELARHYNQAGRLPSRMLFVDERVGSFPFYLSPALRAQLSSAGVRSVMPSEAFGMRAAPTDAVFVLTRERAASLSRFVEWNRLSTEVVGHHVIVSAGHLIQAVKTGRPAPPGVR